MNDQHKIEQLEKALYILLEAVDWDDVQEIGGEPLEKAIENANEVLKDIDSESDKPTHTELYPDVLDPNRTYGNFHYDPEFDDHDDLIEETDYLEEDE